jgi:L-arabinose isomerase
LSAEAASDANSFDLSSVAPETLDHSNRVGLAIRMMLEEERASAFSFNFQSFDRAAGVPTVPFLEASKAMARGVGYAGEGDVLTAALVGALLRAFGDVTFTEMFCPDWRGNAVFMSHMGECNLSLAAERPRLVEKAYPFGDVENPIVALFPLRHGPATLVNIAPGPDDTFHLIAARVNLLERGLQPGFPDVPHFWISPGSAMLPDFLRRYSEAGGTHHLALVLGEHTAAIEAMATILGIRYQQV